MGGAMANDMIGDVILPSRLSSKIDDAPGSKLRRKVRAEPIASGKPDVEVPAVDNREPETAWRHRVQRGITILVKRDLDARDTGRRKNFLYPFPRRMLPPPAPGASPWLSAMAIRSYTQR